MTHLVQPLGLANNRFYDPPPELWESEIQVIAQGLQKELHAELQSLKDMVAQLRNEPDKYTEEQVQTVITREMGRCRAIYRLMCRFIMNPFSWSFYERMFTQEHAVAD